VVFRVKLFNHKRGWLVKEGVETRFWETTTVEEEGDGGAVGYNRSPGGGQNLKNPLSVVDVRKGL